MSVGGCGTQQATTADAGEESQSEAARLLEEYASRQAPVERDVTVEGGELRANITPTTTAEGEIVLDDGETRVARGDEGAKPSERAKGSSVADLDRQIETYATELGVMLAERAKRDEFGVGFGDLARLAMLDAVTPGVFNTYYLDAAGATALTEAQREALGLWRGLVLDSVAEMEDSLDEERLALYREVREREEAWRSWDELSITDASMCTAVYGFGHYDAMNTDAEGRYRLVAGRRYRAVVYVEVEGFTHAPVVREGVDGFESSVALGMSLYQHQQGGETEGGAGDLLTWKTSEESVKDFSKRKRRDFFLVQTVELPETLSTGRYTLKVRVRDLASDRQTEKLVAIDVVSLEGARREKLTSR